MINQNIDCLIIYLQFFLQILLHSSDFQGGHGHYLTILKLYPKTTSVVIQLPDPETGMQCSKDHRVWVPRPLSRIKSLIPVEWHNKLSRAVAMVREQTDKYEKDFGSCHLSHSENKTALTPNVRVSSVAQTRPAKWQKANTSHSTFKGKIEFKKYSREEYDSMSMAQGQQLYELWCNFRGQSGHA